MQILTREHKFFLIAEFELMEIFQEEVSPLIFMHIFIYLA